MPFLRLVHRVLKAVCAPMDIPFKGHFASCALLVNIAQMESHSIAQVSQQACLEVQKSRIAFALLAPSFHLPFQLKQAGPA